MLIIRKLFPLAFNWPELCPWPYLRAKKSGRCGLLLGGHVPTENSTNMKEEEKGYQETFSISAAGDWRKLWQNAL